MHPHTHTTHCPHESGALTRRTKRTPPTNDERLSNPMAKASTRGAEVHNLSPPPRFTLHAPCHDHATQRQARRRHKARIRPRCSNSPFGAACPRRKWQRATPSATVWRKLGASGGPPLVGGGGGGRRQTRGDRPRVGRDKVVPHRHHLTPRWRQKRCRWLRCSKLRAFRGRLWL